MSETEAAYNTVECHDWAYSRPAELLPECETGSVEQMLEGAIKWNDRLKMRVHGHPRDDWEDRIFGSQTQLLRNILAKLQKESLPEPRPEPCGWLSGDHCPNCGASIRVTLEFSTTTHG